MKAGARRARFESAVGVRHAVDVSVKAGARRAKLKLAQCISAGYERKTELSPVGTAQTGGSNSVVESQPSKLLVAGSIPVSRSSRSKV